MLWNSEQIILCCHVKEEGNFTLYFCHINSYFSVLSISKFHKKKVPAHNFKLYTTVQVCEKIAVKKKNIILT